MSSPTSTSSLGRFFSVSQVAESLGLSPWTIRKLIREGELRGYKVGGKMRVREDDLLAYLADSEV
jgi:excisionase family DNA binding protein